MTSAPSGSERVRQAFAAARDEGRAALVIYLPAGYPDLDTSEACLHAAVEAGADVLEVGFPFTDPMMDGPVIQAAGQVALDHGYRVDDDLALCARLTAVVDVPVLAMTYVTIPHARGFGRFADDLGAAGVAGAILPDLPATEAGEWLTAARPGGLATVFLASSASSDDRLAAIAGAARGFVYAAPLLGVTGGRDVPVEAARSLVGRIRRHTDTPVAVGIGVKTRAQTAALATHADGVIVGSAVVAAVGAGGRGRAPGRVAELVAELRAGVGEAGPAAPEGGPPRSVGGADG